MKHTVKITLILVFIFLLAQTIGLAVTNHYLDNEKTSETGEITYSDLPFGIKGLEVEGTGGMGVIMFAAAILIGTLIIFLMINFRSTRLLKLWFFVAISITLVISFASFLPQTIAAIIAVLLAGYKIFKPNVYVHNISELFIYGGLVAILVPVFKNSKWGILWAFIFLIIMSIYDMIAVWKSKHMVKLAKFQTKAKLFAGLMIPYKFVKSIDKKAGKSKKVKVKIAILGGGDIGLPLLFAGAVMANLMLTNTVLIGFLKALIIPIFSAIALFILLIKSQKDKFYPAMPFLTAGCAVGYIVLMLINLI